MRVLIFISIVISVSSSAMDEVPSDFYDRLEAVAQEYPADRAEGQFHRNVAHFLETWVSASAQLYDSLSQEGHVLLGNASVRMDWDLIESMRERDQVILALCNERRANGVAELASGIVKAQGIPYERQLASFQALFKSLSENDRSRLLDWELFGASGQPLYSQPMSSEGAKIIFQEFESHAEEIVEDACSLYKADVRYEIVKRQEFESSGPEGGFFRLSTEIRSYEHDGK